MNIVIAAGGTGGHIYPAVALAEEFYRQEPGSVITFVATGRNLEESILAHGRFQVEHIDVQGVVGRARMASLFALFLLPRALYQSIRILRARCADFVIGTGGYFSPPVVIAAAILGIKRVIVEPNAIPGLANRVLGPVSDRIFLAFGSAKNYFNPSKIRVVGTPVRKEFVEGDPLRPTTGVNTLLVFGGSQGARAINSAIIDALNFAPSIWKNLDIIHQTGTEDHHRVQTAYVSAGVQAQVVPFLFDMPRTLRSADLVVARAGAGTLAELAVCGKAAILIPFPHATHQHQEKNAREVEAEGAAVVIPQDELDGRRLTQEIEALVKNPERLRTMAENSLARRKVDSTKIVVRECLHLLAKS